MSGRFPLDKFPLFELDISFHSSFDMLDMKWSEGRTTIFGLKSKAYREREAIAAAAAEAGAHPHLSDDGEKGGSEGDKAPTHEIV